jgi:hypothetical protein
MATYASLLKHGKYGNIFVGKIFKYEEQQQCTQGTLSRDEKPLNVDVT